MTASPTARLTMLVDALEMDLARADKAFAEKSDLKKISDLLVHAQDILALLRDTLDDSSWEAAPRLKALYNYLYSELVRANLQKDRSRAASVAAEVSKLASAWRQAAAGLEGSATLPVAG